MVYFNQEVDMKQPKPLVLVRTHGINAFSATANAGTYAASGTTQEEAVERLCRSLHLPKDQVDVQTVAPPSPKETPRYSY